MRPRQILLVLWTGLGGGCAVGEPIPSHVHEASPRERSERPEPAATVERGHTLYVDVVDRARRPLAASAVWITTSVDDVVGSDCEVLDPRGACRTWKLEFAPTVADDPDAIVYAEVCELLFVEQIALPHRDGVAERFGSQLELVADDSACAPASAARRDHG